MDANKDLPRVSGEHFEYDDDLLVFNGEPFTGIAYEQYPNDQLEYEEIYREGLPEGLQREWFANGQLKSERYIVRGLGPIKATYWHENGQLQSIALYDIGVKTECREWSEDGEMLRDEKIALSPELKRHIEKMKKIHGLD